jgi:hypothetical protein
MMNAAGAVARTYCSSCQAFAGMGSWTALAAVVLCFTAQMSMAAFLGGSKLWLGSTSLSISSLGFSRGLTIDLLCSLFSSVKMNHFTLWVSRKRDL